MAVRCGCLSPMLLCVWRAERSCLSAAVEPRKLEALTRACVMGACAVRDHGGCVAVSCCVCEDEEAATSNAEGYGFVGAV